MNNIAAVVSYCTNERRFLEPCLAQLRRFCDQIIVAYGDRFFDGSPEDDAALAADKAAHGDAKFVEYHVDPRVIVTSDRRPGTTWYWHNVARIAGFLAADPHIEYVLFLDVDEIVDAERAIELLTHSDYRSYDGLRLSAYWYFKSAAYQAVPWEIAGLLVKRSKITLDQMLQPTERNDFFERMPGRTVDNVKGVDGKPFVHHYSWVRSKEEMIRKVESWGHKDDKDWVALVEEAFRSDEFPPHDFVHNYDFRRVSPLVNFDFQDKATTAGGEAREVSVIIPVFNNLKYTRQCITSLLTVKERVPFEVIVVDNGSTDGTAEYLQQLPPVVRTVSLSENMGFAKGCNAGAREASGEYLVFLNNDTVVLPDWLTAMVEAVKKDPAIGLVGNLQIFPDTGKVQQAGIVCGADKIVRSIYNNELPADHPAVNKPREFQFVAGSCMLIERELFNRLGGFDEEYLNSCEDIDLCMKVRDAGRKVFYCPQSRILHFESKTVAGHDKSGENYQRFLSRWGEKLVRDDLHYLAEDGMIPRRIAAQPSQPRVALLSTYNQHCGLSTYAEFLVAAMQEKGLTPLILAEKTTDVRGPDSAEVLRCWTREQCGGKDLPKIICDAGVKVLHVNHGGMFALDGWLPEVLKTVRRNGVRVVITFHSTEAQSRELGDLARLADRVLVHHAQNELELIALGGTPARIEVMPHGIPPVQTHDLFESKLDLNWNPATKVVSTFGFVEPHKGVLELIAAMKPVHERTKAELHILGGPHPGNPESPRYVEACKQKARDLGLEHAAHFSDGYLPDEEVRKRLCASDVIVMNYLTRRFESSGAAMIALASGRPVISSAQPTFEFAPGLTYKTTDAHFLPQAILDVLENPFIERILRRNVREFEQVAGWNVIAERMIGVYRAVLAAPQEHSMDMMQFYRSHPDDIYAEPLQRERARWLKSRAEGKILEIGPANGYVSGYVNGTAAVEINRGRLAVAQALRPNVNFEYGDAVKGLPFACNEFDTVLAPEILEHVEFADAVKVLKECARVGKRVLVTIPNADKPGYDPGLVHNVEHRWLVNREAVEKLLTEAACTDYEWDVSDHLDFYLLDICPGSSLKGARITERASALPSERLSAESSVRVGIDIAGLGGDGGMLTEEHAYALNLLTGLMAARPTWTFTLFNADQGSCTARTAAMRKLKSIKCFPRSHIVTQALDVMLMADPFHTGADETVQAMRNSSALLVCALHDLVPFHFAAEFLKSKPEIQSRYLSVLRLLKDTCDLFVCPSQSTAQDVMARLDASHERVRIVHGAASENWSPTQGQELPHALAGRRYLLSTGLSGYHRNAAAILRALAFVRETLKEDVRLAVAEESSVAAQREMRRQAEQSGLAEEAIVFAPSEAVGLLTESAEALLAASLWEGSGLSLMNAMEAGLPVIAGDNSAQAEVCGDAALLVSAADAEEIARAMLAILQSTNLRSELAEKGRAQARRFSWTQMAEKTAIYLAEVVSQRRKTQQRIKAKAAAATI